MSLPRWRTPADMSPLAVDLTAEDVQCFLRGRTPPADVEAKIAARIAEMRERRRKAIPERQDPWQPPAVRCSEWHAAIREE